MTKLNLECLSYTPIGKNSLVGKADVHVRELCLTIKGVMLFESHGKRWANLPGMAMIDRNGIALRDDTGKIKYAIVFVFDSRNVRDAFSAAVIRAVLAHAPDAFEVAAEGV